MRQKKSFVYQTLLPILLLVGLLLLAKQYKSCQTAGTTNAPTQTEQAGEPQAPATHSTGTKSRSTKVPAKALDVLEYIRKNDDAPPGTVGGRTFMNREKRLVAKDARGQAIKYREWDVNKKQQGKNRGTERLITGSDGSAYYTRDHYKTFEKIE
jgi:ribonuclease T1